jgi:hypothetical protein
MLKGPERYADVASFAADLFPILDSIAAAWAERAARDNVPVTSYRATVPLTSEDAGDSRRTPYRVEEVAPRPAHPPDPSRPPMSIGAGKVAFQADGKVLVVSGDRLYFFVEDQPYAVVPPDGESARMAEARWAQHVGELGYAIVGPRQIHFLRGGKWRALAPPKRQSGGEVGPIVACLGSRGRLSIITAETDDSEGGPELWRTSGAHWVGPLAIPLGGEVRAMAEGAYGMLIVGGKGDKRARASFLGPDGGVMVYAQGVSNTPPLEVAVCGNERDAWAASGQMIFRFDRSAAEVELPDLNERPVQMALDLVGLPWLVTERSVLRREAALGTPTPGRSPWRVVAKRAQGAPRFAAIGFTPEGARVIDEASGSLRIVPSDLAGWRGPSGGPASG